MRHRRLTRRYGPLVAVFALGILIVSSAATSTSLQTDAEPAIGKSILDDREFGQRVLLAQAGRVCTNGVCR